MKNTFYSQGNPYNIVRTTSATYTASVGELIIADETEITLPSGVPAGSVIAVRSSSDTVTTDVVGASGSIDGFSAGTTHQEAKTGEYVYDGSDWYLRNSVDIMDGAIPDSDLYYKIDEGSGDKLYDEQGANDGTSTGSLVWVEDSSVGHGFYVELDGNNYVELSSGNIIGTDTDFSVGLELTVDSAFSNDATFVHWDAGNDTDALTIGHRNGSLGARVTDSGGAYEASHSQPSAPYTVDLVATWDASAQSVELYLNESASTGSDVIGINQTPTNAFLLGQEQGRSRDLAKRGMARFAVWETESVAPSKFTL